jgi:hypothetical protein
MPPIYSRASGRKRLGRLDASLNLIVGRHGILLGVDQWPLEAATRPYDGSSSVAW